MFSYLLRRLILALPTLFVVILISFLMVHLVPGDPFASERGLHGDTLLRLQHQYYLDLPLWKQFLYYICDLLSGDLGNSFKNNGQKITELIFPAGGQSGFLVSAKIGLISIILSAISGVFFGSMAILARTKGMLYIDYIVSAISIIFISVPMIVTAPLSILTFSVILGWVPSSGLGSWKNLILPVVILSVPYMSNIIQITRNSLLEIMKLPFIRVLRSKGLSESYIIFKHALKPGLIPVVSFLGPASAGIFAGSIVIEKVFTLPGSGILLIQSAFNRDYNLILGLTIVYSVMIVIFNLLVDVIYSFLNPKIRY